MNMKKGVIATAFAAALSAPAYAAEISFSGALEVEAATSENYAGEKGSDIALATAAVNMDAVLNDRVSGTIALLYEEDETDFGLDEAYINLKVNDITSVVAGRMYVPFGNFESNMISDPYTLELGETSEAAVMLAFGSGNISGSLYTFNGDSIEAATAADNDDDELSFGANIEFANDSLSFGASYISNIADTDSLQALEQDPPLPTPTPGVVDSTVAGMGVHFGYRINKFSIIAEHVAAMDNFVAGDLDGLVTEDITPTATNVELAFDTGSFVIAAAYQTTEDALILGFPETATSATVSFEVAPGAGLAFEYKSAEDYSTADGGTGETENTFTAQLAIEF